MQPKKARKIIRACRKIHGWFSPEAALLFAWIDEIQKSNGITGDIFEIGCHHGKSTFFLGHLVCINKEKLGICDLFSAQYANISKSGSGDLRIFNRNMTPLRNSGVEINTFQANSITLTPDKIGDKYRLFHIDGGHTYEETLSDLNLAAKCTIEKGIIAIDDAFRPEWPEVTEALIKFLDKNEKYCTIIVGFNKTILARKKYANVYLTKIQQEKERNKFGLGYPWHTKILPFKGQLLKIFYIPSYVPTNGLSLIIIKWYKTHNQIIQTAINAIRTILHKD